MNGFKIENQDVNTFLTYEIKETDTIDSLSFGMLTNNRIKGVAPILFTQRDETRFFKYNITSKAQASQFFSGVVTKNRLLNVILGITSSVMAAEEYMVDTSFFVFDLEHIYIDTTTYEPLLICLPVISEERKTQSVQAFFRSLVFTARYDQTENCDYVAKLINYFNSTSVFSLSDFKKLVQNLYNTSVPVLGETAAKPAGVPEVKEERQREKPPMPTQTPEPVAVSPISPPTVNRTPVSKQQDTLVRDGLEIPGMGKVGVESGNKKEKKKDKKPEDKMSVLYLIRHYSKENLEIYKAQKDGKEETLSTKNTTEPKAPKAPKTPKKPSVPSGFTVPGQSIPTPQTQPPEKKDYSKDGQANGYMAQTRGTDTASKIPGQNNFGTVSGDFGDTTVLVAPGAAGETSLLTANVATAVKPRPYLVRLKNGEKVLVDKPRFRIGKEKSYVDYFIGDNTAISRSHADIIVKGESYFLVDLNSTNHTFVNGSMLQGNAEVQIKNGNRIRLANEEFDFIEEI